MPPWCVNMRLAACWPACPSACTTSSALKPSALEALASRSLLDIRIAGAVLYKLDPASDDSRALVEQTLAAARADRATVLKLILTGRSVAQDFADAFRVDRKRDGRG